MVLSLTRVVVGPQTPVEGGYNVDYAYNGLDSFKTFRLHWQKANVFRYFKTRNEIEYGVSALDETWDDPKWKLVSNLPGCEKDKVIKTGEPMGVRLAAYKVTENYHGDHLYEFYDGWAGKGLNIYWSDVGNISVKYPLNSRPTGIFGDRTIYRNGDDSTPGTVIPDGGAIGVILDAESPAIGPGDGLIPGVPDAWELPLGIVLGLVAGFFLGRGSRKK